MADQPAEDPRPLAEISHGPSAFEAFLDRNQKGLIVVGIGLILATAAWIVVTEVKETAAENAGHALVQAQDVPALEAVVKDHPDTAAAGSARLLMADMQWENGDQQAAVETLRSFLSNFPEHAGLPSARTSLATRLMQQGQNDEALQLFQQTLDDPAARFLAPYALASMGDIHRNAGRLDEAEAAYKRARDEYAASPFISQIDRHAQVLRFVPPVEIEAPAVPPLPDAGAPGLTPGADAAPAMPEELEGPLGDILSGGGSVKEEPAPPVEEPQPEPQPEQP